MDIASQIQWEITKVSFPLMSDIELKAFILESRDFLRSNVKTLPMDFFREMLQARRTVVGLLCDRALSPEEIKKALEEMEDDIRWLTSTYLK
jgi:uncharacterized protein (DUF2267 family)